MRPLPPPPTPPFAVPPNAFQDYPDNAGKRYFLALVDADFPSPGGAGGGAGPASGARGGSEGASGGRWGGWLHLAWANLVPGDSADTGIRANVMSWTPPAPTSGSHRLVTSSFFLLFKSCSGRIEKK